MNFFSPNKTESIIHTKIWEKKLQTQLIEWTKINKCGLKSRELKSCGLEYMQFEINVAENNVD